MRNDLNNWLFMHSEARQESIGNLIEVCLLVIGSQILVFSDKHNNRNLNLV